MLLKFIFILRINAAGYGSNSDTIIFSREQQEWKSNLQPSPLLLATRIWT
uniref:Uncharacterized protein n=1 Tax=Anguilla anguilla TaxID=7936 RepID=A0A0E9TYE6_ANGAN